MNNNQITDLIIEEIKTQLTNILNKTIKKNLIETAELQDQILDILNNLNKIQTNNPE